MAPDDEFQAKFTVVPLTIGVAVVTRRLVGVKGGGEFITKLNDVDLPPDETVMGKVPVGVWALVDMVKVLLQVGLQLDRPEALA